MNAVSFVVEVLNRNTILWRDGVIEARVRGKDWKDALHRQAYIHNEMLTEMMELIFPVPVAVVLYLIQFSPESKALPLMPILVNTTLQLVQEFLADCIAL